MVTTDLERVINIVQEPVTPAEQRALQWIALLKTGLSDDSILKEIPNDMKHNLTLNRLYAYLTEPKDITPTDQQVLKDIQTLVDRIKTSECGARPYLRVNGDNVACKLDKSGRVEVPGDINLVSCGELVALKPEPSKKFVLYEVEFVLGFCAC